MNTSTVPTSLPLVSARSRPASLFNVRHIALFAAVACLLTFVLDAFWRESYTGDEGFYGVTALNMLHAPSYWLRPSYYPLGDFLADRDGFAHPPFNSYFYAVSLWLTRGSLVGPEVVNLLALAVLLYATYRVVARVDPTAGRIAVLLLAASPAVRTYYSMLEAEPLLTTFGMLGVWCCLEGGFERGRRRWLLAGGLCLGLSFALKLWLCGPLMLAALVALASRALDDTGPAGDRGLAAVEATDSDLAQSPHSRHGVAALVRRILRRRHVAGYALFLAGFVAPAGLHLGAIALVYPQDLGFWFKNIYFGIFTHAGISGSKFDGDAIPANWIHPVWYYGAALYRDHFFVLPPIAFGAVSAWREDRRHRWLLGVLLAGMAGVVPLSVIKVKEPLYVLSCAVCLYAVAAVCLSALARRISTGRTIDPFSFGFGIVVSAALLLAIPAAYVRGIQGDKITLTFVIAHSLVFLGFLAAVCWTVRTKGAGVLQALLYVGGATAVAVSIGWAAVTHRPRDVAIARLVKPYLASIPPRDLAMIASNFKCYQYYAFAKGCYWHDLDRRESPPALLAEPAYRFARVFILDPDDQDKPENAAWLHWLEANTVEKTPELDRDLGAVSGYRIFVRDPVTG